MLHEKLSGYNVILASRSPRRHMLLKGLGVKFILDIRETEETAPEGMSPDHIVMHIARVKSNAFKADELDENTLIITADTIVWLDNAVLGKPTSPEEAHQMLRKISGHRHEVFTGVCLKTKNKARSFFARSEVWFREMSDQEIAYYVQTCSPMDKAGAYGIQDWIGYVGIERIEGSYFNVMGLPTQKLYMELLDFLGTS